MLNVNVEVGLVIKKIVNTKIKIMKQVIFYLKLYYPVVLSFISSDYLNHFLVLFNESNAKKVIVILENKYLLCMNY